MTTERYSTKEGHAYAAQFLPVIRDVLRLDVHMLEPMHE